MDKSVSTDSTKSDAAFGADLSDLGYSPPVANLDLSKEVRLLRARIAQLEQMQSTASSSTSFDLLSEQNLDEINDTAETLDNDGPIENEPNGGPIADQQKLLKHFCETLSKMKLQPVNSKSEKAGQRANRWNSADCHADLFVIPPDCLTVYRHANTAWFEVTVRAQFPMPRGHSEIFYFELTMEKLSGYCHIGLMPEALSLHAIQKGFWWKSDGSFWGHNVHGCGFFLFNKDWSFIKNKEKFAEGDVVGCGLNLATRQIIYTKDGKRLDTKDLLVHLSDLYPFVSLKNTGDRVKANFGPVFKYDIDKEQLSVSK